MSNLTRYTMVIRRDENGFGYPVGKVRQKGEWVKYDDIKDKIDNGALSPTNKQSKQCQCANSCVSTIYVCKDCGGRVNSKR